METPRSEILLQKLISNTLSAEELDELLAAMQGEEVREEMTQFLQKYFEQLLDRFKQRDTNE